MSAPTTNTPTQTRRPASSSLRRNRRPASLSPRDVARRRHVEAGVVTQMARALISDARRASAAPEPAPAAGPAPREQCEAVIRERRRLVRPAAARGSLGAPAELLSSPGLAAPRA
jgi:hypothetical protein